MVAIKFEFEGVPIKEEHVRDKMKKAAIAIAVKKTPEGKIVTRVIFHVTGESEEGYNFYIDLHYERVEAKKSDT